MGTPGKLRAMPRNGHEKSGGANRDRTDDLDNAIVALSQLSYGPGKEAEGYGKRLIASIRNGEIRSNSEAHHAIAAEILRPVQRTVGSAEHLVDIVEIAIARAGHTDADRQRRVG